MAWSPLGNLTSGNSSTANQSTTTTASVTLTAGRFYVLIYSVDNNQTTDGDENAATVTSTNNTWTKAAEFTNGQGAAQAGVLCGIWYCKATTTQTASISIAWTNSTVRDKTSWTVHEFTVDGPVAVEATGTLANDGADPGSLDVTTANIECLRVRGIGAETNSTTALTTTDGNWTAFTGNQTSGGSAATNNAVRGEFRVSTGTNFASNPTFTAVDCASVYVAFKETGINPSLYSDGETFFSPTVTPGAVDLAPSLFSEGDTFHSPTVTNLNTITPSLYEDADTFFTPTVSATYALSPALFADDDTFFTPEVTTSGGAANISPDLYVDGDTFHDATVLTTYSLTPDLYTDDDTFFTPVVSQGAQDLAPDLFSDGDTFHSPTVTAGAVNLAPDLYQDGDTFHSPTVSASNTIAPDLYTDADTFFTPAVSSVVTLTPSLYIDGDIFFTPTVAGGESSAAGPDYFTTFRRRRR